ncbi:MAG TPA: MetQ/NlpA family ABC transporter substrate-binding protein [Flexivirga sp.]|uniref:MetQ/NlpA family ABC transporter substrate-binding protein n=1 Tax=Flexivirga sp. TaxID=1962927 RepID=UPI002C267EBD|nr:MetQ/NlpA family ABC transporter substrate-binding protein [Flexivirga sp.]HWC23691.1 MetQ/NlpA family ABC transporter substrate-binding protein [Flexivirga sp.]
MPDIPDPSNVPALPDRPTLPPRRTHTRRSWIGAAVLGLVVGGGGGFAAGRASSDDAASGKKLTTVKIGVTDADQDYWTVFKKLARERGIKIQTVNFSDYTQANPALAQGQLDLNLFQHLVFLATYNQQSHQTLTPVGSTYVVPLSLYSRKHKSVRSIPAGAKIAIPNDATNQARALLVLQQAGLLKLKGGGNILSTPADVDKRASKVQVTPVDASQTVTSLSSVDGAVINNDFALDGKLNPKSALYSDDPKSATAQPYINVIVAREQDKDNPTYAEVVKLYQDPRVSKLVVAESKNTSVLVRKPAAALRKLLAGLEKTVASK